MTANPESWAPGKDRLSRLRNYLKYEFEHSISFMEGTGGEPKLYLEQTRNALELMDACEDNELGDMHAIDIALDHTHKWVVRTDPSCGPYAGA